MLAVVPEHLFVEAENVKDFVREHVPEFMIPAYPGPSLSCMRTIIVADHLSKSRAASQFMIIE
jgi:hypothetical protein